MPSCARLGAFSPTRADLVRLLSFIEVLLDSCGQPLRFAAFLRVLLRPDLHLNQILLGKVRLNEGAPKSGFEE